MRMSVLGLIAEPGRASPAAFSQRRTQGEVSGPASSFIDRSPAYAFALLSVLYFTAVASLSSFKLLWFDELITLHIARVGSAAAIWNALAHAADPNPPLIHLAVLGSRLLFGEPEWALRLPAALGYWIGMFSLFLFLRRRIPGTWAMAGTLLSMTNAGFDYSFESRSYGVFYGLTMLAILCWSRAVDLQVSRRTRLIALIGMVLALALGISTNYFAILAFLPVVGGELVRTKPRPRPRTGSAQRIRSGRIWVGLAVALTPMLAYRPLIQRSVAQYSPYAYNRVSLTQVPGSYSEMVEYILYPLLALFSLAFIVRALARRSSAAGSLASVPGWVTTLASQESLCVAAPFPRHEIAAALVLMAYPILGYTLAELYGGMFSPRLVIPVCLGFAIVGIATAFQLFQHLERAGTIILMFLLAWFVARESYVGYIYKEQKQSFYRVVNALPANYASGPIVISDPLMALTFKHYAPGALGSRVIYPIDFSAVRSSRGDDSPEENLWAARNIVYNVPLVPLAELQRSTSEYLVLAADDNWLVQTLKAHHYAIDKLPIATQAGYIGEFTPLAHGMPAFFVAAGDKSSRAKLPTSRPRLF